MNEGIMRSIVIIITVVSLLFASMPAMAGMEMEIGPVEDELLKDMEDARKAVERYKQETVRKPKKKSSWWKWALGAVVVGGGAALALSGGEEDEGGGGEDTGTISGTW